MINPDVPGDITITPLAGWDFGQPGPIVIPREDAIRPEGFNPTSDLGEAEGHFCTLEVHTNDVHIGKMDATVVAEDVIAMYAVPDRYAIVSDAASYEGDIDGTHLQTASYSGCAICGQPEDSETRYVAGIDIDWTASASGITTNSAVWTGPMAKGGHTVHFSMHAECQACGASTGGTAAGGATVYELSLDLPDEYLGLNMTDDMKGKYVTRTATAKVDPAPPKVEYAWSDCGRCEWRSATTRENVTYGATDKTGPSSSYRAEPLTVGATVTKGDLSASANCTTNFTVVKVDVEIGGVGEDEEESVGAFVQYAPDAANRLWTEEGTNALVAVLIKCEPKDLPDSEAISISVPPKTLYLRRDGKYNAIPEEHEFPLYVLRNVEFFLHGHDESKCFREREIRAEHKRSVAVDVARFTSVKLRVTNIKFNHDTGSSVKDAINIRRCHDDSAGKIDVSNGEWMESNGVIANEPFCYTTNRAVTVKARFEASAFISSAIVGATCSGASGSLSNLMPTNVVFSNGVSSPEYVEFKMDRNTLSHIDASKHGILSWSASRINGGNDASCKMNATGPHVVYTILAEPKAPWKNVYGDKENAWTNALELSCSWARGCGDCIRAAKNVTTAINGCGRFAYDTANGQAAYLSGSRVELSRCIERLNGGNGDGELVNCTDCASFVVSFANLLGCELYSSRMGNGFGTREYTAIGRPSWTSPDWGWGFSYHEVAWTGQCMDGDLIFDACLKYNGSSSLSSTDKVEELPLGVVFCDGSSDAPYVYRERLTPVGSSGYDKCMARPAQKKRREIK